MLCLKTCVNNGRKLNKKHTYSWLSISLSGARGTPITVLRRYVRCTSRGINASALIPSLREILRTAELAAEGQLVTLLLLHLRLLLFLRLGPVVIPTPVQHHVARREDARQLDDAEADEPDPDGLDLRPEPLADGHGEDDQLPRVAFADITLRRIL